MPEGGGEAKHWLGECLERKNGAAAVFAVTLQLGEIEEELDGERRPGRRRVVGDIAGSCYQLLRIARGIEECADPIVPEPCDHRVGDLTGVRYPALVERELVDGQKSQGDRGVVLQKSADPCDALLVRAHHSSVADHLAREEFSVSCRQRGEIIPTEGPRRGRDTSEHQAVPGSEDLLVAAGPDAARARIVESLPRPLEDGIERCLIHPGAHRCGGAVRRHKKDILPVEVSAARDAAINLECGRVRAEE